MWRLGGSQLTVLTCGDRPGGRFVDGFVVPGVSTERESAARQAKKKSNPETAGVLRAITRSGGSDAMWDRL
jgi:hypothetical protein